MPPIAVGALIGIALFGAAIAPYKRLSRYRSVSQTTEGHGLTDSAAAAVEDVASPFLEVDAHPTPRPQPQPQLLKVAGGTSMSKAFLMLSILVATLLVGGPAMALPKPTDAVKIESASPTFSRKQIHDFAAALVEIYRIRQALKIQSEKAPPQARETLAAQAATLIAGVIERHDLDQPTFNAISGEIEKNRTLRRQVRQLIMEERVGF